MINKALFRDLMAHYDPDKQPIQEFKILSILVKDPTTSSSATVVQQILDLTNHQLAASRDIWPANTMKGGLPWNVSSLVMEIATHTPSARQAKLLDFIVRLQKNMVVDPTTGQDVKYGGERLWNELPTLANYVSDFWHFSHDTSHSPSKILEWENKTSFLAKITAASPVSYNPSVTAVHPMDYSHYGLYACIEAFEDPDPDSDSDRYSHNYNHNHTHKRVSNPYETQVRTACIWLMHAGHRLYQSCENYRPVQLFEGPVPAARGFDQLRWGLWKEGLFFAQTVWKSPATQDLIRRASREVDCVE